MAEQEASFKLAAIRFWRAAPMIAGTISSTPGGQSPPRLAILTPLRPRSQNSAWCTARANYPPPA